MEYRRNMNIAKSVEVGMKNDKTWVCPHCKQTYPDSQKECWQCWHNYYLQQLKQKKKQEKQDGV